MNKKYFLKHTTDVTKQTFLGGSYVKELFKFKE